MVSHAVILLFGGVILALDETVQGGASPHGGRDQLVKPMVMPEILSTNGQQVLHNPGSAQNFSQFLQNLYNSLFDENGRLQKENARLPQIIHSYEAQVVPRLNVINFTMRKSSLREFILRAEIRLKVNVVAKKLRKKNRPVTLGLYDRMTGKRVSRCKVHAGTPTWVRFPVQSILGRWARLSETNRGLQLKVERKRSGRSHATPVMVSMVTDNTSAPFMIVYADQKAAMDASSFYNNDGLKKWSIATPQNFTTKEQSFCSRRELRFDTVQLFGERLVAPLLYNAYSCTGSCGLPDARGILTNHAFVRLTARQMGSHHSGIDPCCVPTILSSLWILYYKESGHMVLRQMKDMVAKECGCR